MSTDISRHRFTDGKLNLRRFHQARWDEPVIFELSVPGQRGILVPKVEEGIAAAVGDPLASLPEKMRRTELPKLPELSQPQVLRHYVRLSQENLGADLNIDVGQGTCTMKYSPKINDQFSRLPEMTELHPWQDEDTIQGILGIMYRFEGILKEISGLDFISLQPATGSEAIYTNVSIIRAYQESRGELNQRDEIITTIFSHPSNAACAKTAGFKVITLYPDENGYPDIEALKAAVVNATGFYYGSEDWSTLNKAGDRKYGNYDFWVVVEAESAFMWKRVAECRVSSHGRVMFLPSAVLP